jgi:amino acid transporter
LRPNEVKKLTTLRLAAATYFLVAGGPYGLEELIQSEGYSRAAIVVLVMPLVFSLPISFMVGELATAIPEGGGYYAWTRRAFGPAWGFIDAWLSLCASFFDMALYPLLFVFYLRTAFPAAGPAKYVIGVALIAVCTIWNLRGARSVGNLSLVLGVVLLVPFVVLTAVGFGTTAPAPLPEKTAPAFGGGLLIAMWNFMGWDNASTFASEVESPQKTYPKAMALAVFAVTLTYLLPVLAAAKSGLPAEAWTTGAWVFAANALVGKWLGYAIAAGGALCAVGMYNALLLSFSRLPAAMAEDGLLPKALAKQNARGVPVFAVVVCSVLYSLGLFFDFQRLLELDILFYGTSIMLEFCALVALRIKEPKLERPFKVPGGVPVAVLMGLGPGALFAYALHRSAVSGESHTTSIVAGGTCLLVGAIVLVRGRRRLYGH